MYILISYVIASHLRNADSVYFILITFNSLFNLLSFLLCGTCAKHLFTYSLTWGFNFWATWVRSLAGPVFLSNRNLRKAKIVHIPLDFIHLLPDCGFLLLLRNSVVFSKELESTHLPSPLKRKKMFLPEYSRGQCFITHFHFTTWWLKDGGFWKCDSCIKNEKTFSSLLKWACTGELFLQKSILEQRPAVSCAYGLGEAWGETVSVFSTHSPVLHNHISFVTKKEYFLNPWIRKRFLHFSKIKNSWFQT